MQKNISMDLCLSRIGLGLILFYCLAVSKFAAYFAQIHVSLSFLPFPIFVGEILLFICLVLFLSVSKDAKLFNQRSTVLLSLYFAWVLLKALINYYYDGPLTCRNAALFYYPVFAVFTFCFYQKAKIPGSVLMSLALLTAGILFFMVNMGGYYWWTYLTLFAIAVWNTKSVKWRWFGWVFLVVILLRNGYLYQGSRSHIVSVFGAVVFLVFYFGALLAKRRNYAVLSILFISLLFFILGFFVFSDRNAFSSLTSLKGMINTYQIFDREYQARQGKFVSQKLSVHLYNYKNFENLFETSPSVTPQPAVTAPVISQPKVTASVTSQPVVIASAASQLAEAEKARPKPVVVASTAFQPAVTAPVISQPKVTASAASQLAEAEKVRELEAEIKRAGELAAEIQRSRAAEIERAREQAAEAEKVRPKPVVVASTTSQPAVTAPVTSQRSESGAVIPASSQYNSGSFLSDWLRNIIMKIFGLATPQVSSSGHVVPATPMDWLKNIQRSQNREGRLLDIEEGNIVFRLFIWRDMVHEFIQEPGAWLGGFSFGHPQRSRSLEVLNMGEGEWSRDGWITPHNSFFHIIYRAGILGVGLIVILFFMIGRLVRDFFNLNSVVGGLLVGALVYWLVLSNFLVILEFPYNAIVFWPLFGITMAYRDGLKL